MNFPFIKTKRQPICVCMEYDASQQVITRFFDAVRANPDTAWVFVSKVYSAGLDLNALRELLASDVQHVKLAAYASSSARCITRSVYVKDPKRKGRKLLHLHMVSEPDHNGKWKVFGVEQEEWI